MTRQDYAVEVVVGDGGWEVLIMNLEDEPVGRRACATEREARTYASTVRQHLRWLSPERFRSYYRLPEPD